MKLLFENKKYLISIFLTILMVFCTSMSGYANIIPVFTDGDSTTRSIAENTASGVNIGSVIAATDVDNDVLTYTLGGTDASAFRIVSTSGQLQTNVALNYETKSSYSVSVSVSDGNGGSDSIAVTINVTDVNEKPSFNIFGRVTLSVAENTTPGTNIGTPFQATDPDSGDTLTYSLQRGDKDAFSIDANTGQVKTRAALDYETKNAYTNLAVRATDSTGLAGSTLVTINVTDVDENSVRDVDENSVRDVDENNAPVFTDGSSTTRTVAENTDPGTNIGAAVAAMDADNDALTYSLGGTDAASFSIVRTSGQLRTNAALDYETKPSYSVSVSVSDGKGGSDSITVTINVTDVAEITPPLSERTPQVRAGIVAAVPGVSDADDVTVAHLAAITSLDLSRKSISALRTGDFNGLTALTTLDLSWNGLSNISALEDLTALTTLNLWNNIRLSDISALEKLTALTWLDLSLSRLSDISALEKLTALTELYLKYNPISDYGPLQRLKAAIEVIEGHRGLTLDITIPAVSNSNVPVFSDGDSTTRSVAENTAAGTDIGGAVSARDADTGDTLTYHLGGTDASSFSIVRTSGQLQTNAALDYETKSSYTVKVAVSDGKGGSDTITVTINVTDVAAAAPSVEAPPVLPKTTALLTNFPNPFNPETWIPYQLAEPAEVTLTIYDIQGRVVRTLRLGHQPAGFYQNRSKAAHWDGRNYLGEKVATGIYFYTLKAGDYMATRKLLIRK